VRFKDGEWSLVDHDFKLKRTVWARENPDGSTTYRTDYAVDPLIDMNTAQRNMAAKGFQGDWHHVASVPLNVAWEKLVEPLRQGDDAYVSRFLNDSDNRAWRTKEGRL
jgi:hypothetical protein